MMNDKIIALGILLIFALAAFVGLFYSLKQESSVTGDIIVRTLLPCKVYQKEMGCWYYKYARPERCEMEKRVPMGAKRCTGPYLTKDYYIKNYVQER